MHDTLPDLSLLCSPRSVALVGASDDPGSIGGRALINLLKHSDFQGEVMLVNPKRESVAGRRCWPDVASLPSTPDLVLISVPAVHVNLALRQAAARGVSFAIVYTSGFGEAGPAGKALEEEMRGIVASSTLRVYGPNCPGLCNINERLGFTFSPSFQHDLRRGPIGLATQGGGLGRNVLQAMDRGLGIGLWCSSGNEVDLQVSDFIAHMADAEGIEVIVTLIEGIKDGRKFVRAVQRAAANGKPVIALKVGRSAYGQKAAMSHTGSLTGSAEVNSALFRQLGVIEVDDIDELADMAALVARSHPPKAKHDVAIYCSSGGASALTADMVGQAGLTLAQFGPETTRVFAESLPSYAAIGNPVDTTTAVITEPQLIDTTLLAVCEDPGVALVLFPVTIDYGDVTIKVAESAVRVQKLTSVPILPVWMSSRRGEAVDVYAEAGLVPVGSVGKAVKCVKRWLDWARWRDAQAPGAASFEPLLLRMPAGEPTGAVTTFNEADGKALMHQAGIAVPASGVARSADEAVQVAQRIGYPVVAKVLSADITHKTEAGGVMLGIADEAALREAWSRLHGNVSRYRADATIDGLLVEAMAPAGGVEVLVGVSRDAVLGPVLTFGLGGIHVELFRDVARRVLPLSRTEAEAMVREIRAFPLLDGVRGRPKADVPALVDLLMKVSGFVAAHASQLDEMDLNPVWVGPVGQGVLALDAVIVGRFGAGT
jgi:acyl-CoA synthetase (NDP forming)